MHERAGMNDANLTRKGKIMTVCFHFPKSQILAFWEMRKGLFPNAIENKPQFVPQYTREQNHAFFCVLTLAGMHDII